VITHNLGCAAAAARLANQPQVENTLMRRIRRFNSNVQYELNQIIDDISAGKGAIKL
jgi:hypothetical protein